MKVQDMLTRMEQRAFNDEFMEVIIDYYKAERQAPKGSSNITEDDFNTAMEVLLKIFTKEQKELVNQIESIHSESRFYAARYGFLCGLYSGFRQHFTFHAEFDGGFTSLVADDLFMQPKMQRHYENYNRHTKAQELEAKLSEELPEDMQEHMVSISCAWSNRIYNASFEGFYCGYRAAFDIADQITPMAKMNSISKILTTEYYMGYIKPFSEVERLQELEEQRNQQA